MPAYALAVKKVGELFGRADSPTFAAGGGRIGAKSQKIFGKPDSARIALKKEGF